MVPRALIRGLLVTSLALAALLGCGGSKRPGTPPKHLLLITVDTLRADHLSAYLYGRPTSYTPATDEERGLGHALSIDDLADSGVLFRNAYSPRGQTTPALASLMTGRSPLEHGVLKNQQVLGESAETLAESLHAAGFATAGFTANALLQPASGLGQGFGVFQNFDGDDRDLQAVTAALQWIGAQDREAGPPTFLWLHLMGPHLPYDPPSIGSGESLMDFATKFTDPDYGGAANGSREFLDQAYLNEQPLDGLDVNHVVALYDGEVARTNFIVRTFLQMYSGVYENPPARRLDDTLIVFAADHGEELRERNGYWAHSKSVYSSVLHVPLIIRHAGSLTGRRVIDELVTLEDVLPTLLEWFDVAGSDLIRGRSLLPLVDTYEEFEFESRPAFGAWRDGIFTVRVADDTGNWRLVWNPDQIEPPEKPEGHYFIPELALFDLAHDSKEQRDVSAAHPEVVSALKSKIAEWLTGLDRAGEVEISEELAEAMAALGYGEPLPKKVATDGGGEE